MWDSKHGRHGLYDDSHEPLDYFIWITHNRDVEVRAHLVDAGEAHELFCQSMGRHWSEQCDKLFWLPEKQVQKGKNDEWMDVKPTKEFGKQYATYDHALIGRALLLSKLEEAAKVRHVVDVNGESNTEDSMVEVASAFDRRFGNIINQ